MRIGLFTSDDRTWSLSTWTRTIPVLQERHEVVGVYLVPERLGEKAGREIAIWYLRVFGLRAAVVLALYSLLARVRLRRAGIPTWEELAKRHELSLRRGGSVNSDAARRWLRENEIDVLFILISEILRPETLAEPRIGVINKHAAVLPSARGVFPFFWARLRGLPVGVSFHAVDSGIDTGPLLVQQQRDVEHSVSMLRFYIDDYGRYPKLAAMAVEHLAAADFVAAPAGVEPSYFGFPTRADAKEFARKGYRVARLSDLWHRPAE